MRHDVSQTSHMMHSLHYYLLHLVFNLFLFLKLSRFLNFFHIECCRQLRKSHANSSERLVNSRLYTDPVECLLFGEPQSCFEICQFDRLTKKFLIWVFLTSSGQKGNGFIQMFWAIVMYSWKTTNKTRKTRYKPVWLGLSKQYDNMIG